MLKASETAPLAQDGRSPLSNPLQSYISAGVHRVRGGTRQRFPLHSLISGAAVVTFNVLVTGPAEVAEGNQRRGSGFMSASPSAPTSYGCRCLPWTWRRQANGPRNEAAGDRMQAPPVRQPVPEAVHRYAANFDRSGQGLIWQASMPPLARPWRAGPQ